MAPLMYAMTPDQKRRNRRWLLGSLSIAVVLGVVLFCLGNPDSAPKGLRRCCGYYVLSSLVMAAALFGEALRKIIEDREVRYLNKKGVGEVQGSTSGFLLLIVGLAALGALVLLGVAVYETVQLFGGGAPLSLPT